MLLVKLNIVSSPKALKMGKFAWIERGYWETFILSAAQNTAGGANPMSIWVPTTTPAVAYHHSTSTCIN